jgi:hypothetical protein
MKFTRCIALGAALAALAFSGQAAVLGTAEMLGGAAIVFHDIAGPCKGAAKFAEYIAVDGERTGGCWVRRASHLAVVFFDGDVGAVPHGALTPPKEI